MKVKLRQPYLSIKVMDEFELPRFSVLTGRNGVGKTQLLKGIAERRIGVSGLLHQRIESHTIETFQPQDARHANWEGSKFAQSTIERYFMTNSGCPLVEVAENTFQQTLKQFCAENDADKRRKLEETLRTGIRNLEDFQSLASIRGDKEVASYFHAINKEVISKLSPGPQQGNRSQTAQSTSVDNNQQVLVSLAMKLSGKLPHEIRPEDVFRASYYEDNTIGNQISQIFIRYKVEQFSWAHNEGAASDKSVRSLMEAYREGNRPPWEILRSILDRMRDSSDDPELFNFAFSDPEQNSLTFAEHQRYSFQTRFTNRATGESYSITDLSSGEKILLSLCLAAFNRAMGCRQPGLLLLDELDALLHPSMISALIVALKDQFVSNGTCVIMATHSVTTVSLLDEGEIFCLSRSAGRVAVRPVTRAEAVAALSEGLATIDAGLKIASSESAAPITILSEGNNVLHLKKWAKLLFPGQVEVFGELRNRTGKNELSSYGRLLAKVQTNSHFLIVLDCDATKELQSLQKDIAGSTTVTAFAFEKRSNQLAPKGIENLYDEEYLNGFITTSTSKATGRVSESISNDDKIVFARHVLENGK